ncbi:hypothetical protein V497_05189 [Pseudogymnoascus sp. VKM F-4516 (FW-969)]|nr:hypothetical protein V490_01472 [Pseudogymnoascus sp. VKM F-3557]KFY57932.1 hypothetical protein V497_05189 [Pseudogymnoascus sp. VKM F-4516 (FW-969)]
MANNHAGEFPLLAAHNLYAAEIKGDGNCLFNALSDQIYGDQSEHNKIRARVIEYMREHAVYFKQFIEVLPGGGQRRNPKRKNANVYSTPTTFTPPTQDEIDRVFETHLGSMARGGTYGDNMEISAFTSVYKVDVKIYQRDFAYMITAPEDGTVHPVAHIAYHTWQHYSSIRNTDGPYTGLPNVHEKPLTPEEEAANQAAAAQMPQVFPWMVNVVQQSLPYLTDEGTITRILEAHKGNIDAAVGSLLDAEDDASISSQDGSASTERDPDSDDEDLSAPNKKQDRRMSRATRAVRKAKAEERLALAIEAAGLNSEADTTGPSDHIAVGAPSTDRPRKKLIPKSRLKHKTEEGMSDSASGTYSPSCSSGASSASPSRSSSVGPTLPPKNNIKLVVKPPPVVPKRITARERGDLKKAAQKAARKESKRAAAAGTAKKVDIKSEAPTSAPVPSPSPPTELGMGIRTLYI